MPEKPERADFSSERVDRRLRTADFRLERVDFRPEKAEFRPERAWGGRTEKQTNERKSPESAQKHNNYQV